MLDEADRLLDSEDVIMKLFKRLPKAGAGLARLQVKGGGFVGVCFGVGVDRLVGAKRAGWLVGGGGAQAGGGRGGGRRQGAGGGGRGVSGVEDAGMCVCGCRVGGGTAGRQVGGVEAQGEGGDGSG